MESVRERVPVLLNDDDETVEVAWKERLTEGVYRLEIELFGNDGDVIEHRETIIESDLSPMNASEVSPAQKMKPQTKTMEKGIPGFSVTAGIAGLAIVFSFQKTGLNHENKSIDAASVEKSE